MRDAGDRVGALHSFEYGLFAPQARAEPFYVCGAPAQGSTRYAMKPGPADRLDPDIADLLRAAEPYPEAPPNVQARVEQALAMRIADVLAGSTEGSEAASPAQR